MSKNTHSSRQNLLVINKKASKGAAGKRGISPWEECDKDVIAEAADRPVALTAMSRANENG